MNTIEADIIKQLESRVAALERKVFEHEWDREEDDQEEYDDWDEKDEEEERYEDELDLVASCKCGAWQLSVHGNPVHVADCCCGAE